MKIWTLVWLLVFPPEMGSTLYTWQVIQLSNMTGSACFELLAEKEAEFQILKDDGKLTGYEVYCSDNIINPTIKKQKPKKNQGYTLVRGS